MSAERERIKRAMGIGIYPGKNNLADMQFKVTRSEPPPEVIEINGLTCLLTQRDGKYHITCATFPTLSISGETVWEAREKAADALWALQILSA
ncbi:MAG: hypothetical protein V7606_2724 [Burkholderiales bacterium]|jgi:hypothetical protein|nr:hypothetical protein [Burkholderia sp.]